MWHSEVGAEENIRLEPPCGGRGRKKESRKTRLKIEARGGNGNKFTISV